MEPWSRDQLFFELDPILFVAQRLLRKVRLEAVITGDPGNVFPIFIQFVDLLPRPWLRIRLGVFESELDFQRIRGDAAEALHHVQRLTSEGSDSVQPGILVYARRVYDERVAFRPCN